MSIALPESLWEMVEPLGWVLVHFVWQGMLIGIGLACALAAMRQGSAKWRYCASLLALGGMGVMPFVTLSIPALSRPFPAQERIAEVTVQPPVEMREVEEPIAEVATKEFDVEDSGIELESDVPMEGRGEFEEVAAGVPPTVETKLGAEVKSVGLKERIAETAMRLRPWLKMLVAFWLAGVLLLSFRLVRMWNRVQRLRCVGVEEVPDPLVSRLEELARRLGLQMRVNLLLSQLVEVPTLIGWLRPVILLPAAAVTGLTPSQLDAILVHELAHIRRHDYLVNLMQSAVETLLFYHPAVWWVSGRLRAERENCCDDLTVEILGDPINYGRALLVLEEQRGASTNPALVLGSQGGSLLGRIERLVVRSNGRGRSTMGTSMSVLVGMLMLSCATMLMVRGGDSGLPVPAEKETHFETLEKEPLEVAVVEGEGANRIETEEENKESKVDKEEAEGESKSLPEYQFRIVDSRGKPVVGAKVTPVSVSAGAGSMSVSDAICTATISDQEGNAHLKFKIDLAAKAVRIPLFEIQEFLILGEPSPPGLNLKIEHPDHPVWNGYVYPNGDKPIVLADSSSVSIRGHRANSDVPLERLYPVLKGRANWSQERGILTLRNLNLSGDGGERWLQVVHVPEEGSALYGDLIDLAALKDKLSEPLVVELKSGVRVTGSVDSKIPRPIRNGIVLGQITNHRGAAGFNQMSIKQAIESDGTFVIDSLPRGTDLQVVALCEGWVSRTPPVAELKEYGERYGFANSNFDERNNSHLIGPFIRLEGESISPVIAMIPTTTCEVTVLDRDEAPLPGVAIIVSPGQLWHDMGSNMLWMGGDSLESIRAKLEDPAREISPASFNGPTSYRGETDSQGRVTISGLPSQIDPNGRKVQFAFMGSKEGYRFSNGLLYGPIQSMEIRRGEQGKITLHMERDPEYRASVGESKPAEEKPNPAPVPEVKDEKSDVGGDGKVGVAAAGLTAETVVARVGDTEIRAREVLEAIAPQLKQLRLSVERLRKSSSESQYTDLLKQVRQIQEDQIKKRLPDMVEIRLLSLAMTDHLKTLNQSQVLEFNKSSDEFLNNSLNRIQSTLTLASRDEVESRLIKEGYDFHVLCEQQREAFLANAFHSQRYLRLNEPTAEKIRAYYDSNLSRYTQAERIVWEAIQFVSERDGNPELPQDLVRQIRSDFEKGRPVDEIVKKHPALIQSISKEDDKKTDLESFSDPNLTRILTVLPIGGVSELRPILGDLQFVRVVNRLPAYVTPFEQCKGEIAELLKKQEAEIEYDKLIEELRGKYPVWTIVNGHPHRKRIESWSWAGMPPPGPVIVWLFSEGDTGLYRSARSRELR